MDDAQPRLADRAEDAGNGPRAPLGNGGDSPARPWGMAEPGAGRRVVATGAAAAAEDEGGGSRRPLGSEGRAIGDRRAVDDGESCEAREEVVGAEAGGDAGIGAAAQRWSRADWSHARAAEHGPATGSSGGVAKPPAAAVGPRAEEASGRHFEGEAPSRHGGPSVETGGGPSTANAASSVGNGGGGRWVAGAGGDRASPTAWPAPAARAPEAEGSAHGDAESRVAAEVDCSWGVGGCGYGGAGGGDSSAERERPRRDSGREVKGDPGTETDLPQTGIKPLEEADVDLAGAADGSGAMDRDEAAVGGEAAGKCDAADSAAVGGRRETAKDAVVARARAGAAAAVDEPTGEDGVEVGTARGGGGHPSAEPETPLGITFTSSAIIKRKSAPMEGLSGLTKCSRVADWGKPALGDAGKPTGVPTHGGSGNPTRSTGAPSPGGAVGGDGHHQGEPDARDATEGSGEPWRLRDPCGGAAVDASGRQPHPTREDDDDDDDDDEDDDDDDDDDDKRRDGNIGGRRKAGGGGGSGGGGGGLWVGGSRVTLQWLPHLQEAQWVDSAGVDGAGVEPGAARDAASSALPTARFRPLGIKTENGDDGIDGTRGVCGGNSASGTRGTGAAAASVEEEEEEATGLVVVTTSSTSSSTVVTIVDIKEEWREAEDEEAPVPGTAVKQEEDVDADMSRRDSRLLFIKQEPVIEEEEEEEEVQDSDSGRASQLEVTSGEGPGRELQAPPRGASEHAGRSAGRRDGDGEEGEGENLAMFMEVEVWLDYPDDDDRRHAGVGRDGPLAAGPGLQARRCAGAGRGARAPTERSAAAGSLGEPRGDPPGGRDVGDGRHARTFPDDADQGRRREAPRATLGEAPGSPEAAAPAQPAAKPCPERGEGSSGGGQEPRVLLGKRASGARGLSGALKPQAPAATTPEPREKRLGCDTCRKMFVNNAGLQMHRKVHARDWRKWQASHAGPGGGPHASDQGSEGRPTGAPSAATVRARVARDWRYECGACGKAFASERGFRMHRKKHARLAQMRNARLKRWARPQPGAGEMALAWGAGEERCLGEPSAGAQGQRGRQRASDGLSDGPRPDARDGTGTSECGRWVFNRASPPASRSNRRKKAPGWQVRRPVAPHADKQRICKECGEELGDDESLRAHRCEQPSDEGSSGRPNGARPGAQESRRGQEEEGARYTCDRCGTECVNGRGLSIHYSKHLREEAWSYRLAHSLPSPLRNLQPAGDFDLWNGRHRCEECGKSCLNKAGLQSHRKKHAREAVENGGGADCKARPRLGAEASRGHAAEPPRGCSSFAPPRPHAGRSSEPSEAPVAGESLGEDGERELEGRGNGPGAGRAADARRFGGEGEASRSRPSEEPAPKRSWENRQGVRHDCGEELDSSSAPSARFRCEECGREFDGRHGLQVHRYKHAREAQSQLGEEPVSNCAQSTPKPELRENHQGSQCRCEECGKEFESSRALNVHRFKHTRDSERRLVPEPTASHHGVPQPQERPERSQYRCDECGKDFDTIHGLHVHLSKHSREAQTQLPQNSAAVVAMGSSSSLPNVQVNPAKGQYGCGECGHEFDTEKGLQVHRHKHFTGAEGQLVEEPMAKFLKGTPQPELQSSHRGGGQHWCEECGKGFGSSHAKNIHRFKHKREAQSQLAEKPPPGRLDASQPEPRENVGKTLHACEECGKGFGSSHAKNIHRFKHKREAQSQLAEKQQSSHLDAAQHESQENVEVIQYRCEECGREFDSRHGLQVHRYKHAREAQSQLGEEPVSICAQSPPKPELRENHQGSQCRCEECGKEFESSRALNVHRFKHTRDSERRLVQEPTVDCPKSSPRESQEHPETSLHRCEECGKGFSTSHAKNIHRFKHKREAQSQLAEHPSLNYRDVPQLQPREGDFDGTTLHRCEECGKGFGTSRAMNIHRFKHTRDSQRQLVQEPTADYQDVPQPESQERPEASLHRCEECGKGFGSSHAKNVHRYKHKREAESRLAEQLSNHSESSQPKALENPQEENQHRCDECGKEFDSIRDLQVHRYSHAKEAQNRVADGQMLNRPGSSSRPDTQKSWHERQHVCKECGEEFDFVRDLQVHIYKHARERQIQLNERPISKHVERAASEVQQSSGKTQYKREEYGEELNTNRGLSTHFAKRMGEAEYQPPQNPACVTIDGALSKAPKSSLHGQQEGLHRCEECGKGFGTSRAMNIHRFKHTRDTQRQLIQGPTANYQNVPQPESQERPEVGQYRCEECGKGFNSSRGLQVHRFKHTREGEGQLNQQPIFIHLESSSEPEEQKSEQGSQYVEYAQEFNTIQGPGVHLYKQDKEAYHKLSERPISKGSKRSLSDVQETAETSLHHCEECGKGFATSHAKNIHRFKHKREAQSQFAEQQPANHRDVPGPDSREGDVDGTTLHRCEECGKGFGSSRAMNIHRFKHTRDSQRQLVQEPSANYQNVPQPESRDYPAVGQYRCEECGKGFNSSRGLQVHRFKHTREGEGQLVQLPIFIHLESSSEPEEQKSEQESQYMEYAQEFDNIQSQYKHEKEAYRNLGEKPISKDSQRSLSEVQQITEKRLYRCEECGKEFGTRKGHEVHRLKHTKDAQGHSVELAISSRPETSPSKAQKNPEQNRHKCGECGKEFDTFRGLSIHFSNHSMEAQNRLPQKQAAAGAEDSLPLAQKSLDKIQHGCEECGKTFDSYRGLQVHYFKHRREAEDQLNEESMPKRHKATTQPEVMEVDRESQHTCEECGKEFGNYLGLQIHRSKHAKEVQRHLHQRTLADHFESWQPNAQDDARTSDRNECGKEFDAVRDLQVHRYNHTKQGAYGTIPQHRLQSGVPLGLHACKKCGIVFPNEQGLQLHQKKHVADTGAASGQRTGD